MSSDAILQISVRNVTCQPALLSLLAFDRPAFAQGGGARHTNARVLDR